MKQKNKKKQKPKKLIGLPYIKKVFNVPAEKGCLIEYILADGTKRKGVITHGVKGKLRIVFFDTNKPEIMHPWTGLMYLPNDGMPKEMNIPIKDPEKAPWD